MSGKPIITDVNPAPAAEGTTGILSDLRAGTSAEPGPELGDLGPLSARPTRRVSIQTLVVALVLAASALSLYIMRRQGMRAGMNLDTRLIVKEIEKVGGKTSTGEVRIWADLARSSTPLPAEERPLQKNPFVLDTPADGPGQVPTPTRDLTAERQAMIREKLGLIKLGSVMDGPTPIARINDRFVKVGDMIEDMFLVAQIHDRSVDFIVDGRTYTLNMGDGGIGAGKKTPRGMPAAPANPRR